MRINTNTTTVKQFADILFCFRTSKFYYLLGDGSLLLHIGFLQLGSQWWGRSLSPCMSSALQRFLLQSVRYSHALQSCSTRAQKLWYGFVAPRHVGSSWTRDPTGVSCTASEPYLLSNKSII